VEVGPPNGEPSVSDDKTCMGKLIKLGIRFVSCEGIGTDDQWFKNSLERPHMSLQWRT